MMQKEKARGLEELQDSRARSGNATQFVSRIPGARFNGFCHAATASITAIGGRIGLHLSSRKPAWFSSAQYSASVRSRPGSITIMLTSKNGASPGSPIFPRSPSITITRPPGRIARRHLLRMRTPCSLFQSCRIFLSKDIGLRDISEKISGQRLAPVC